MKKLTLLLQILCLLAFSHIKSANANIVVCIQSSMGDYCIELYDDVAPTTVYNFIDYVNTGAYNNSIIHRSVPGFVVQGGGFALDNDLRLNPIATNPPIKNEFQISNTRGTIAMAKLSGDPDSATSQWFINLADNSEILDSQNGGFTVFGKVIDNGMDVIDNIATLPTYNFGDGFSEMPLQNYSEGSQLKTGNLIINYTISCIPPGQVSLSSPSGSAEETTPTFIWINDASTTWYKLLIWDSSEKKVYTKWYDATEICTADNCSVSLETELPSDSYEWWVKSWNDYGSVWSDGTAFTIQGNDTAPSKVTHTFPSGKLAASTSTFSWTADPASTWYRLWVGYPGDIKIYAKWYDATSICSDGNCTVTTGTEFNGGDHEWYVKSWNDYGKIWSDGMNFTVNE